MNALNYVKIVLLCVISLGLSSCGDEYYTDDYLRNSDEKLCGKTWVEEVITESNDICRHQLKFARGNSGQEAFYYFRSGENNYYKSESFNFTWKWIDGAMENLELNYGGGDISFFDNVWVREHNLSGKLKGEVMMFVDANYYK